MKILAIIVGVFLAALLYLQSQNLININWDKFQSTSEAEVTMLASTLTDSNQISLITETLGVPMTSGLASDFAIGFMKG